MQELWHTCYYIRLQLVQSPSARLKLFMILDTDKGRWSRCEASENTIPDDIMEVNSVVPNPIPSLRGDRGRIDVIDMFENVLSFLAQHYIVVPVGSLVLEDVDRNIVKLERRLYDVGQGIRFLVQYTCSKIDGPDVEKEETVSWVVRVQMLDDFAV